jgi:catechol 2,3-dioxygenase-like lactoylglutathione lyase family enzyme
MIGYATLGVSDLQRSAAFYDAVLGELDATRCRDQPNLIGWRFPSGGSELYILSPYNGEVAHPGNGPMLALLAASPNACRAVYKKAIALGATDEGRPGPRDYSPNFYAAYFRDIDGNKFNVFCFSSETGQLLEPVANEA